MQVEARSALLRKPSGRLIVQAITNFKTFPGIGESRARAMWEKFGESIYPLLTIGSPEPFVELLGSQLALVLVEGWAEIEIEAEVYQWLDARGLPVWLARKLLAIYGQGIVIKLEENPYRLLAFTTWPQADQLGRAMGIADDDERRLVAAADAACYQRHALAHTWSSWGVFIARLV